jgi:hypothetical protein
MPAFFFEIIKYIFDKLNLLVDVDIPIPTETNRERYRLILNGVSDELELTFNQNFHRNYNDITDRETFFYFCKYAKPRLVNCGLAGQASDLFNEWKGITEAQSRLVDIAQDGWASLSGNQPEWAAQGLISGVSHEDFAIHTELEPAPWWRVDLRELREISVIEVWNRPFLKERAVPLIVRISQDGINWKPLATINYPFGSGPDDCLTLNVPENILARFVELSVGRPSYLHLRRVRILTRVIQFNQRMAILA